MRLTYHLSFLFSNMSRRIVGLSLTKAGAICAVYRPSTKSFEVAESVYFRHQADAKSNSDYLIQRLKEMAESVSGDSSFTAGMLQLDLPSRSYSYDKFLVISHIHEAARNAIPATLDCPPPILIHPREPFQALGILGRTSQAREELAKQAMPFFSDKLPNLPPSHQLLAGDVFGICMHVAFKQRRDLLRMNHELVERLQKEAEESKTVRELKACLISAKTPVVSLEIQAVLSNKIKSFVELKLAKMANRVPHEGAKSREPASRSEMKI